MGTFIAIKIFAKLNTGNSPKSLKELKVASSFSFAGVKIKSIGTISISSKRMKMIWRRYEGWESNLTDNPIPANHKSTNVYSAKDRVSEYVIRQVILEKEP